MKVGKIRWAISGLIIGTVIGYLCLPVRIEIINNPLCEWSMATIDYMNNKAETKHKLIGQISTDGRKG